MPLLTLFLWSLKPKYNMADTCSLFCHKNNYGEFVEVIIHLQKMENEHFCRALMFFDKYGSGYIELDELREALADESGACSTDVVNEIMREVDTYKDGEISYEEFVAMMKTRMIG